MKKTIVLSSVMVLVILLALAASPGLAQGPEPTEPITAQAVAGTAFTYQGRLTDGGSPANGSYDFEFRLYDALSGGSQVATVISKPDQAVAEGLFTVQLDFGSGKFDGNARYLEIKVRPGSGGTYTTLSPRQALTPAPYALALPGLWTQQNATSPNLIGGYSGNSVTTDALGATIGGGGASGDTNRVTDDYGTVGGGADNRAGVDDGTTNNQTCATVGGGGSNRASGDYATVGGGWGNTASSGYATVSGGYNNTAAGAGAFVGGGGYNGTAPSANQAQGIASTIGGGYGNVIIPTAYYATVGGGTDNEASGYAATVGGGEWNTASGSYATVGGGE